MELKSLCKVAIFRKRDSCTLWGIQLRTYSKQIPFRMGIYNQLD
jgi:hypothetical protein